MLSKLAEASRAAWTSKHCLSVISTGVYGYPADDAAEIAVQAVREFLEQPSSIQRVIFCCFSDQDRRRYETLIGGGTSQP